MTPRATAGSGRVAAIRPPDPRVIELLRSARLDLEPLRIDHAAEAAPVFDDERLHTYTGGFPAGAEELGRRYRRQAVGHSPDGREVWLNWMLRDRATSRLVGTVQATIAPDEDGTPVADLAWVVGTAHQSQGYAREGATAMAEWLRRRGVDRFRASVHPEHEASMGVARALGLAPSPTSVDGEIQWVNG